MVGEIGGNDYNYAFFSNKRKVEILDFVPQVVASIKKAVEVSFCSPGVLISSIAYFLILSL